MTQCCLATGPLQLIAAKMNAAAEAGCYMQVDPDKAFAVQIKHEESVLTGNIAYMQCAVLFSSSNGERRIRWDSPHAKAKYQMFCCEQHDLCYALLLLGCHMQVCTVLCLNVKPCCAVLGCAKKFQCCVMLCTGYQ